MPRVSALYRYPVKGFTPESCDTLAILPEGRVVGDRVLAFRFANSGLPTSAWSKKHGFVVLVNTPGIARLAVRLRNGNAGAIEPRLSVSIGDEPLVEESLSERGRERIASAVQAYVMTLRENPLSGRPERVPLELIGDGSTPRYQDSEQGQITLHSRESLAALAHALDVHEIDELRFRSNIAIEGVPAWTEQGWLARTVRIGEMVFDVVRPKVRCLATHANPATGERDLPVMQTLVRAFRQQEPTFAVALMPRAGGEIRVGDRVSADA